MSMKCERGTYSVNRAGPIKRLNKWKCIWHDMRVVVEKKEDWVNFVFSL